MRINTWLKISICTIVLAANGAGESSVANESPVVLADEYLVAVMESEKKATTDFLCAINGEAFAGYESRPTPLLRGEVFLLGQDSKRKIVFCSASLSISAVDTPATHWQWDQTVANTETKQVTRKSGIEYSDGRMQWMNPTSLKREVPVASPFALALGTRMGWMAHLLDQKYVTKLATEAEPYDARRSKDGKSIIGRWAVNSRGCVLVLQFDPSQGNMPSRVEWYTLPGSKSVQQTVEKGWLESASDITWRRFKDGWVPENVVKTDNGTSKKKGMLEEWRLDFDWRFGPPYSSRLSVDPSKEWNEPFKEVKLVNEAYELVSLSKANAKKTRR